MPSPNHAALRRLIAMHLVDPAAVQIDDLETPFTPVERLARHRNMPELRQHEAGERRIFVLADAQPLMSSVRSTS